MGKREGAKWCFSKNILKEKQSLKERVIICFFIDPTLAEAFVAWKAAVLCIDLALCNVILESDALDFRDRTCTT